MYKKCKVVMLPTSERAENFIRKNDSNRIQFVKSYLTQEYLRETHTGSYHLYILSDDRIREGDYGYCRENRVVFRYPEFSSDSEDFRKIIATTDKSLKIQSVGDPVDIEDASWARGLINLPQPSQAFIKKYIKTYNEGNKIEEVMVEYEDNVSCEYRYNAAGYRVGLPKNINHGIKLKISKDNTITIEKIKDSWNKEEVIELINSSHRDRTASNGMIYIPGKGLNKDWINKNL